MKPLYNSFEHRALYRNSVTEKRVGQLVAQFIVIIAINNQNNNAPAK
jgi:hypothetical protein